MLFRARQPRAFIDVNAFTLKLLTQRHFTLDTAGPRPPARQLACLLEATNLRCGRVRLVLSTSSRLTACEANKPSAESVYDDRYQILPAACRSTPAGSCNFICSDGRADLETPLAALAPGLSEARMALFNN